MWLFNGLSCPKIILIRHLVPVCSGEPTVSLFGNDFLVGEEVGLLAVSKREYNLVSSY